VIYTFHREVGFPHTVYGIPQGTVQPRYSHHALQAAANDRYGRVLLPRRLIMACGVLVELTTTEDGTYIKGVWRFPYNNTFDLCVVLTGDGTVKTVWLNSVHDKHTTLDRARYHLPRK
jgi:hypothetical protein